MYRLLMVEDEYHIREGIRRMAAESGLPLLAIDEAEDGRSALDAYARSRPDIVLLDINLPDMNGLEVARLLREQEDDLPLLFLTGYESMEYIRRAIELRTLDYLLKPVTQEELTHGLLKAEAAISSRRSRESAEERRLAKAREHSEEHALLDLLTARRPTRDSLEALRAMRSLLAEARAPYSAIVCDYDAANLSPEELAPLLAPLPDSAAEAARRAAGGGSRDAIEAFGAPVAPGRYAIALAGASPALAAAAAAGIRERVEAALPDCPIPPTIGIGLPAEELQGLADSYRQAALAAEHRGWVGDGQTIPYAGLQLAGTAERALLGKELALLAEIQAGNEGAVSAILAEWTDRLRALPFAEAKPIALQLVLFVMRVKNQTVPQPEPGPESGPEAGARARAGAGTGTGTGTEEGEHPLLALSGTHRAEELIRRAGGYVLGVARAVRESREAAVPRLFERARQWIRERLHEDIGLNALADFLHLSPKYVSARFKQVTGECFADYLNRVRFERARELLLDPSLKVADVAEAVGFGDVNYFSIAFKRHTGLTPSEYRRRRA